MRAGIPTSRGELNATMPETLDYTPRLAAIQLYPIKALDGISVREATIRPSGGLRWDREFHIADAVGNKINGKRTPRVHDLRAQFDLERERVEMRDARSENSAAFDLNDTDSLETWLTGFFEQPVTLRRDPDTGFPDDLGWPGPTVLSEASIAEVASWYPNDDQAQIGRRFRANLILSGVPPFWEDRLIGSGEQGVRFTIGDVEFMGVNACARCIVVTRDPVTGATTPEFQKIFSERRRVSLPEDVDETRFNHYFRLSVNTVLPDTETGKRVRVGDELRAYRLPPPASRVSLN